MLYIVMTLVDVESEHPFMHPTPVNNDHDDSSFNGQVTIPGHLTPSLRLVTRSSIIKKNPQYALSCEASTITLPKSVCHALGDPQSRKAMCDEYDTMVKNQSWVLVDRLLNDNVVNFFWLFKVKDKVDGIVDRLKAHLVANDMNQIEGLDYHETFLPIIKPMVSWNYIWFEASPNRHQECILEWCLGGADSLTTTIRIH